MRGASLRAKCALTILVCGYAAIAIVAGAPNSPLTVLPPAGVQPPSWAAALARTAGLNHVGRDVLTGLSWILVLVVLGAFGVVLREAWSRRVRVFPVLVASAIGWIAAVAAPLLLSRDVYTYAAYGRIEALYHQDPYVAKLSSLPHDPFVAVTPGQWLHTHSVYGPAFTLASDAIVRVGSVGATILTFKLLAGIAIAAATLFATLAAKRLRPERAALAAALVGLNPVLVVHTVGGGHVDALIAAPLAAAAAIAVTRPPSSSARAFSVTVLLTAACLIKVVMAPVLALWFWSIFRADRRRRVLAGHTAVVVAGTVASLTPFVSGWHTLTPFTTLGGTEAWASPSHLVGRAAQAIVDPLAGSIAGTDAAHAVQAAFMLLFLVGLWLLARRNIELTTWGTALLLLALSMPYLLPWYAAWFTPFLALITDDVLLIAGTFVAGVLALTLIPADPFHGLTTPAVMNGVHYGAASVLLVVLVIVALRIAKIESPRHAPRFAPDRVTV